MIKNRTIHIICTCLLSCVLLMLSIQTKAQQYPFINYDQSKLYLAKDSSQMMSFYKKIDELREGKRKKVTVVHFGGSHIQAGFWTEVLMDGFQSMGNFKGGGTFIFPFKIVKSNSPHFFKSFTTGKWIRKRSALAKEMCDNLGMAEWQVLLMIVQILLDLICCQIIITKNLIH